MIACWYLPGNIFSLLGNFRAVHLLGVEKSSYLTRLHQDFLIRTHFCMNSETVFYSNSIFVTLFGEQLFNITEKHLRNRCKDTGKLC